MADVTFADYDPQDTDSELIILQKTVIAMQACVIAKAGSSAVQPVQDTDSYLQIRIKHLQLVRELQVALGA